MISKKPHHFHISVASKVTMIMVMDILATITSFFLGLWLRYDFSFAEIRERHLEGFLTAIGPWCAIIVVQLGEK